MKSTIFTIILILFTLLSFSQKNSKINAKEIDKTLEELKQITKTVGFSVAIVRGNEIIYAKGFGYSDLENKIKADENTLYPIGSTSKAFTTALLGIMEEEKDLSFNDSPKKYLPELEFYNNDLNEKVTILDMVSHRTGMPRHDHSWYLFPTEDKDSLLSRIKHHEPFKEIREQWYYNNFMYLAQGLITEKLTGKSWEDNIRERFFQPLNMKRSNLNIKELQEQSNISKGYSLEKFETNKVIPYFNIAAVSPAGSINSSVLEMSNWLKIWLNKGKFEDKQVLPESYIKKAGNPLIIVGNGIAISEYPDQHLNSYGYAWFISSYKGHYRMEHGGNIDGFSANVALFPTDNIGIVVLSNQDGSALPVLVRNAISDHVLGLEKTDWKAYYNKLIGKVIEQQKTLEKEQNEIAVQNNIPSHDVLDYTGVYYNPGYGKFRIEHKNDSLFVRFKVANMLLRNISHDVFKPYSIKNNEVDTSSGLDYNFNFQSDDLGEIEAVKIKFEPQLDALVFKKIGETIVAKNNDIEKYVGSYALSGINLKVFINDEKQLILSVPGQPNYTLIYTKDDEFKVKELSGYKARFDLNSDKMYDLVLVQPNGTFVAKKTNK